MRIAKPKDMIVGVDECVTIATIAYQRYDEDDGWDIEFTDTHGKARHWKQFYTGGKLVREVV